MVCRLDSPVSALALLSSQESLWCRASQMVACAPRKCTRVRLVRLRGCTSAPSKEPLGAKMAPGSDEALVFLKLPAKFSCATRQRCACPGGLFSTFWFLGALAFLCTGHGVEAPRGLLRGDGQVGRAHGQGEGPAHLRAAQDGGLRAAQGPPGAKQVPQGQGTRTHPPLRRWPPGPCLAEARKKQLPTPTATTHTHLSRTRAPFCGGARFQR